MGKLGGARSGTPGEDVVGVDTHAQMSKSRNAAEALELPHGDGYRNGRSGTWRGQAADARSDPSNRSNRSNRSDPSDPTDSPLHARLTVPLGVNGALVVWEDRVEVGTHVYPYDDWFGVRLLPDPRAPLIINPPLAVALVTHDSHWDTYVPPNEQAAIQVVAAVREACQRLGIEPIGIDDVVRLPEPPRHTQPLLYRWEPRPTDDVIFGPVESVLMAIVHLSVFFLPIVLPLLVWRTLTKAAPTVASHAKEAAEFQGVFYVVMLPMLGYTVRLVALYGMQPAALLGLMAVGTLLVLGVAFAGMGASQALLGRGFSYRGLARAAQGLAG